MKSRGGGVVPRRSHKPQTQVQILPPQQMFKQYLPKFLNNLNIFELYTEELIQILILGVLLVVLYFTFSFLLSYSLKITYSINEKRRKFYVERLSTIIKAIKSIAKYILLFIFVVFALNKFNINLTVVLTGAGFLGATIILIFQNTLRDIFSGWIFFFEDLFREGEQVMINNSFSGRIIDFKSRFLILRGDKGEIISLPYSQINIIHNFSRKRVVSKLILKFKRESLKDNLFESIENSLKNNFPEYQNLDFNINKNFNLYENALEITLVFKAPLNLKDEISHKIKSSLVENFSDSLLEIKNES